jgi:hypothetical protein
VTLSVLTDLSSLGGGLEREVSVRLK